MPEPAIGIPARKFENAKYARTRIYNVAVFYERLNNEKDIAKIK